MTCDAITLWQEALEISTGAREYHAYQIPVAGDSK
jgi:hypothetical protein